MTQQHKLTTEVLIAWHKERADHYKPFGADNIVTKFHTEAAELIEALKDVARTAQRIVNDKVS